MTHCSSPVSSLSSGYQPTAPSTSDSEAATEPSERDAQPISGSIASPADTKLNLERGPDDRAAKSRLSILSLASSRTLSNDEFYAWHRQRLRSSGVSPSSDIQRRMVRQVDNSIIPRITIPHVPASGQVDPFSTLPIEVDYTTNELLHFYLGSNTAYWSSAYALSSKLRPSLKSAWESFMPCTEHFHILMARSALHQLRINSNLEPVVRKNLRLASIAHQGKAVMSLRQKVGRGTVTDQRDIFVAVLSMATFEQRYGQRESAKIHFAVGRKILHNLGKRGLVEDSDKLAQALWFEGIYTEPEASFMWSAKDLVGNHILLTSFLKDVDQIWRSWQEEPALVRRAGGRKRFLSSRSLLHTLLHRNCRGQRLSIYQDIDQEVAQTRCLLVCVAVIIGLWTTETKLRSSKDAVNAIQRWTDSVDRLIRRGELDADAAIPDLLWCLLQDPTKQEIWQPFNTKREAENLQDKLKDFDIQECHWRVSGIANAVKYLPEVWQRHIRKWLLDFLDGAWYDGELVVDQFAYSYAAGQTAQGTEIQQFPPFLQE